MTVHAGLAFTRLVSVTSFNCKATPTNDTNYSCHIKAVELLNQSYRVHIMPKITPPIINSLRGGHTHADFLDISNFKKPGMHLPIYRIVQNF